ncbi:dynein heavy chain, cytoplasmic protein (macronuclear) [Tetrahymena thermophila SB210]|uniref:Dynein heavy chain, cytoplasmic n=1 Tax=Tetrahymena thermophila (strain SB210) TaxID=312017 RepID=Q23DR0_TETTS|nr:dynein heavy chain, cytoplasmic protein [Tetrahymena thermophila SB210]EAR94592.2 dynein heavy chain, cytoplasmic protein [Tetrahymena thermophila SB210]|eukprot:XP_001014626.2 dynein heavy chain, cytoplasmic protein [Tetrahymena thermophila SB210]
MDQDKTSAKEVSSSVQISLDELEPLNMYLSSVCITLLSVSQDSFHQIIHSEQNQQVISKFASSSSQKILIVSKLNQNKSNGNDDNVAIEFSNEIESTKMTAHSIAFIKRHQFSIFEQVSAYSGVIQVINLGYYAHDSSPISVNHLYVQNCFLPIFNAYRQQFENKAPNNKQAYQSLLKKLSEFNLALIQCQQNVEVPEIQLFYDPVLKERVQKLKAEGKNVTVDDFEDLLDKNEFIDSLANCVTKWTKDIRAIINMDYEVSSGSTLQEINYWLSYERSLNLIDQQISQIETTITIELLKKKFKHNVIVPFEYDLKFKHTLQECTKCNQFMKEFPLNDLLSASSLQEIRTSLSGIFNHMKNIKSLSYTPQRAYQLLEALSRDLNSQIVKILSQYKLMTMNYDHFTQLIADSQEIFKKWDKEFNAFKQSLKGHTSNCFFLHVAFIQTRLEIIMEIRKLHQTLNEVIQNILSKDRSSDKLGDTNFLSTTEINEAFSIFDDIDVLNSSEEGEQALKLAKNKYEQRIDQIEIQITLKLRDKLGQAKENPNEMFRIFSKFNKLFVRPHIRGAIVEYQSDLLEKVQKKISQLREKFVKKYVNTETSVLCKVRDIPNIAGSVIWTNQMIKKLNKYMDQMADVLGEKWVEHPLGQKCKETCEAFKNHLNPQQFVDMWSNEILDLNQKKSESEKIFKIVQKRKLELDVNYDERQVNLFKETRILSSQKVRFLSSLSYTAQQAKNIYPFAMSIQESIRSYNQISNHVDDKMKKLVASFRRGVHKQIRNGMQINWNGVIYLSTFTKNLAEQVQKFEEAVNLLKDYSEQIESILAFLKTCHPSHETFKEKLEEIQKLIDDINFQKDYSNLHIWVPEVDAKIEDILVERLVQIIRKFVVEFETYRLMEKREFIEQHTRHELKMKDQVISIEPSTEFARYYWFQQFHKAIGIICSLPRLEATRYSTSISSKTAENIKNSDYSSILLKIPKDVLIGSYNRIDQILRDNERYVNTWLSYQSLWAIDQKKVYELLGDDINKWQQLLSEIKQGRSTFDNSDTDIFFGPVQIDYRLVQVKINNKYDQWHREILDHFGLTFGDKLRDFNTKIYNARLKLEKISFNNPSVDVTIAITEVKEMMEKYSVWNNDIEIFRTGQKLLERQKYQYPNDWLWLDQVEGEWSNFRQLVNRKNQQLEKEIPTLQEKILQDEQILNEKIRDVEESWSSKKPSSGEQSPIEALDVLNIISGQLGRVKDNYSNCCKAKLLLNLEPGNMQKLEDLEEDINSLKEVWQELNKVWQNIEALNDTLINAIQPKKIKEAMDNANRLMTEVPNKIRTYEPYEKMRQRLKDYGKMNRIIDNLKTEAMKPRHWSNILKKMKLKPSLNELTLGHLWSNELVLKYERAIEDVLSVAQGEFVLECMMKNVKEYWNEFELDMVNYQNKCKLIKGWDDLFAKLDEDLGTLASTKMSPYYKQFEEEITPWDEKLQRIRILLDSWIDVQRKWVYLEGIFFGASDIKTQLQNEYNRFKGIDSEFTSHMKKVAKKPLLLDVISIPGLQKTLERLADMLAKIQKALGEYLETQRSAFARFYFIGDEDLLEIIGNSKDVTNVQRHFPKMYAGITTLTSEKNEKNDDIVKGMNSKEGESVAFDTDINVGEDPKINVWLGKVDDQMRLSLASNLQKSMQKIAAIEQGDDQSLLEIIAQQPAQSGLLSLQVFWCSRVEKAFETKELESVVQYIIRFLEVLATNVVKDLKKDLRQKYEQIITDFVHQRDVTRQLIIKNVDNHKDFAWQYHMRFTWFTKEQDPLKKLLINMANASFHYGFEYLGVGEKLVQTPLTDKCYLTLTQALHLRMGGSPFGPAGTGKTESVKALGSQLGRFVLVFNCDETFDFHAMGRIFVGLCQVGAWGCFDEFNRLEERMLSACSQQILIIQSGLRERATKIELMNRDVKLNPKMGVFVTMNPGYAGRSNLPENLKQLFRQMAMVKPDRDLIAQVMLYSQGFRTAEKLSGKIVSLFELCNDQLSSQPHYDFGLRALKSVLVSAGNMKRVEISKVENLSNFTDAQIQEFEQKILLRSVCETIVPKLVSDDVPLLSNLLSGVFPGSSIPEIKEDELRKEIEKVCAKRNLLPTDLFMQKILQLYQIQRLHHGVMMVGPSGCGKSVAWRVLLEAMYRVEKIKGESYIVDPKAIHKDELYGKLDNTTLEWTDGVFTGILRKITENVRGESSKRHWIIFDGDVDPEWAENLNSVLDDNKLLTLPNGERISIPPNVRIMFEVETLKYATLATVSRCGMVWFSDEIVSYNMIFYNYVNRLKQENYDEIPKEEDDEKEKRKETPEAITRKQCVEAIQNLFLEGEPSFGEQIVEIALSYPHVMEFTRIRVLEASFALIRKGISNVLEYNESHPDYNLDPEVLKKYMQKWTLFSLMWGIAGSMTLYQRQKFGENIAKFSPVDLPPVGAGQESIIDFEVRIEDGEWYAWKKKVPQVEVDPMKVTDADLIITTVDTLRHQEVLCSWLSEHRPFLLCGPPGSGKTMTLMSTLKALTDFEMIFVNFSSSTTPSLILKQFDHYCEYVKTTQGLILRPKQPNKWLVVFCDEINLPDMDKYGTMTIITFLRELTEQKGFWRPTDKQWISLERIQFVGACNPPTDTGRKPLSARFLRHTPLILVDFPGPESLKQIYGTFNRAMLKKVPHLRNLAEPLTNAMVEFYTRSQLHFTADIQPHYIYSPRELTRWKYAINEALEPLESPEDLVRLWTHEAMRLFQDRLVKDDEKEWCEKLVDEVAQNNFPSVKQTALERPILFSNYINKDYRSVEREELRKYVVARLKIFNEEQLDVPIVVFDSVLDHILRIDRVLRQPLGHLLLVGASGVGKTTLTRFVSWMNNLVVYQIKAGRKYNVHDFDNDLRDVMKRAGVKQEKICFIFDESNVLGPAFLEKMNALLASGEIPGLFEGEEYMALMSQCREAQMKENKMMDTDDQVYRNFIKNVQRNLHVVFTMNPANPDFSNRTASSPALFNRCVIDWFGDWSQEALWQVGKEFTQHVNSDEASFTKSSVAENVETRQLQLVNTIVHIHNTVVSLNRNLAKSAKKYNYITPRDYLDFIKHFMELLHSKRSSLEDQQLHLNKGLEKLKDTEEQVATMESTLKKKKTELEQKEKEANEKLKLMVSEQNKAEQSKDESIKLTEQVDKQKAIINEREQIARQELAEAEPALIKAKESVNSINRAQLDQIRSYAAPPKLVQITMEAVIFVITNTYTANPAWADIKKQIANKDFIKNVLDFSTDNLQPAIKNKLIQNYLKKEEWNVERIYNSSQAAGPLALWVESQIRYADILLKVDPLKKEVDDLKKQGSILEDKKKQLDQQVELLQEKISQLKSDYAILIADKENIKNEMIKVKEKVERSQQLLQNLSSERFRWDASSQNFKQQMATIIGDVLLSGAFCSYIGFFDHFYRRVLMKSFRDYLENSAYIRFRKDLSLIEFLSKPSDRLNWQSHRLPNDDLCTENAIILSRFHRYPLIIDPAGQAQEFVLSFYKDKKIARTSFADDAFMKTLETSLCFGCPLLVQDVERIDPILNSVLNKEVYKAGGRVLIRVGDQEIDFSSSFQMFMITRDSNARFTPDLCSRVTFVNFTVTPSSLQNQCLNIYLKSETPETEEKRIKLMKLQGEYIVRLRELEDSLLDSLSNVTGSILDNESVIGTLEKLKSEATNVQREMEQSDKVMQEVQKVTSDYIPLAEACSKVFFALVSMKQLHYLYDFSLNFFMEIFNELLHKNEILAATAKTDLPARRRVIYDELFIRVFQKVTNSLLDQDRIIFALRLTQIKLGKTYENAFMNLAKAPKLIETTLSEQLLESKLTKQQLKLLEDISTNTTEFSALLPDVNRNESSWVDFILSETPEDQVPSDWAPQQNPSMSEFDLTVNNLLRDLTVIKIFRPDRFLVVAKRLVSKVMGSKFLEDIQIDMKQVVEKDSNCKSPILMCSAPGFDPSYKVDALAKEMGVRHISVAIGSQEGFDLADKAIQQAAKSGIWVLLKNVHLAPSWLSEVEKSIHRLTPHNNFRLFLTMEFNPKVPSTLIRQSYKLVFEPPSGIKASLQRSFASLLTPARTDRLPRERSRLHFLLAWLHAILLERLRYTPIGYTKVYEFNEADQRCSLDLIDEFVDSLGDRSNIDPDKLPWEAIRTILCQNLYGGKIDNEYDGKILESLVEHLFNPNAFNANYDMFSTSEKNIQLIKMPEAIRQSQYVEWIEKLPNVESPAWSGLPVNAEKILKEQNTERALNLLWTLQDVNDEEIEEIDMGVKPKTGGQGQQSQQVQWLRTVQERSESFLKVLPQQIEKLNRTATSMNDPLFRFLEREITVGTKLLNEIKSNLKDVIQMAAGNIAGTNVTKQLAKDVYSDVVPKAWVKFNSYCTSLNEWIFDFKQRIDQFNKLAIIPNYQKSGVWIGQLLYPEAYMTATRQFVAQNNAWSLEELELQASVYSEGDQLGDDCFLVKGMSIEGADWKGTQLLLSNEIRIMLPPIIFKWARSSTKGVQDGQIMVPVYLNKARKNLIFSLKMNCGHIPRAQLYQKAITLIAWNNS